MRTLHHHGPAGSDGSFAHEALLYAGMDGFLSGTTAFLAGPVAAGEPVLVAVSSEKIDRLRAWLGDDHHTVTFVDLCAAGRNPARILPIWSEFVSEHGGEGRRPAGIGEPVWAERTPEELVECEIHESLLNYAFAGTSSWSLLCPYDTRALPRRAIEAATRTHPVVIADGVPQPSSAYRDGRRHDGLPGGPLPEPDGEPIEVKFGERRLRELRRLVARTAGAAGLDPERVDDLVLAVNEVATNSVRHGGGGGRLRLWDSGDALVCEVRDHGHIEQPLAGRRLPAPEAVNGMGLWTANHLCDLVQMRSSSSGTVVRLHMARR